MDDGGRTHRPRAAVVLTGSELLTGVIADANGPWLAHELTALGFEVAHLLVVGDRPEDLADALRFFAAAGCVLVVTSGGLGPTADDLTGEVVAAFAGVELQLDEAMRERIAAIVARFPRIDRTRTRATPASASRRWCRAGPSCWSRSAPRPASSCRRPAARSSSSCPGRRASCRGCGRRRWRARRCGSCWRRCRRRPARQLRYYGLSESEIAATLRGLEPERDLSGVEVTTCLRRSELEVDLRPQPGRRGRRAVARRASWPQRHAAT